MVLGAEVCRHRGRKSGLLETVLKIRGVCNKGALFLCKCPALFSVLSVSVCVYVCMCIHMPARGRFNTKGRVGLTLRGNLTLEGDLTPVTVPA